MALSVKLMLTAITLLVLSLQACGIISSQFLQRNWQIPARWLQWSRKRNMLIWGTVLGSGMWTYNPVPAFYIVYVYIGLFAAPYYAIVIGMVYGLSRTLPTLVWLILRRKQFFKPGSQLKRIGTGQRWARYLNVSLLFLYVCAFIIVMLGGYMS
jgi:hypothetical protein